jgi:AraC-like DNA-binding protein
MPADQPLIARASNAQVHVPSRPLVRPVFIAANTLEVTAATDYRRHQHHEHEVIHVARGTYRCEVDDVPLVVKQGQVLIVGPGQWHEDHFAAPQLLHGLHFRLEIPALVAMSSIFGPSVTPRQQIIAHPGRELLAVMAELRQRPGPGDLLDAGLQDARAAVAVWLLLRQLPPSVVAPALSLPVAATSFVQRLERLVERHQYGRLPVPAMARAMGMSVSQLSARCRRECGRSPAQILLAAKIERARTLLHLSDLSVQEVAAHLGFSDAFHFSKAFRRLTGLPPSLVRTQRPEP